MEKFFERGGRIYNFQRAPRHLHEPYCTTVVRKGYLKRCANCFCWEPLAAVQAVSERRFWRAESDFVRFQRENGAICTADPVRIPMPRKRNVR